MKKAHQITLPDRISEEKINKVIKMMKSLGLNLVSQEPTITLTFAPQESKESQTEQNTRQYADPLISHNGNFRQHVNQARRRG